MDRQPYVGHSAIAIRHESPANQSYLHDIDGMDERYGNDGSRTGHSNLLEEAGSDRGGGGEGGLLSEAHG